LDAILGAKLFVVRFIAIQFRENDALGQILRVLFVMGGHVFTVTAPGREEFHQSLAFSGNFVEIFGGELDHLTVGELGSESGDHKSFHGFIF
jgi:hypothetical protein